MPKHLGIGSRLLAMLAVAFVALVGLGGAELLTLRNTIVQEREAKLRDMVGAAERLVAAIDAKTRLDGGTQTQAQEQAAAALRAMRWGDGDYYGVYHRDGLTIVHGNPRNEGVNRLGYTDPTGKRLVAEIIGIAEAGGGTTEYTVPRANGGEPLPKLTFVGRYEPWHWAIQAGVYVDDLNATLMARATRLAAVGAVILAAAGVAIWKVSRSIRLYQAMADEALAREAEVTGRSERRFRSLIQSASDVVLICSRGGAITYQSPAAEAAWGYGYKELLDVPSLGLVHPDDAQEARRLWTRVRRGRGSTGTSELRLRDGAGHWRYAQLILTNLLHEPAVDGVVATAHDINERKAFEQQLAWQAFHDSLTDLPNRALFRTRLDQAIARAERRSGSVGLLFLDLDDFKFINDSLGHHVGDELLVEAARRLQACVGTEDTVARLGGDEFVILLERTYAGCGADTVAKAILKQFTYPFFLGGRNVAVSASIGVASGDGYVGSAEDLLREADAAMYSAKSGGKGRQASYESIQRRGSPVLCVEGNDRLERVRH